MFDIQEELKKIPDRPGVYLMYDGRDEIIYIGKAKILSRRVRQYFDKSRKRSPKIEKMVSLIDHFEYIVTDSEVEALILENNLIKENRPRYNTMLKDDKTYPYIKLTLSEAYPRLVITRKIKKDRDKYYGPYPAGTAASDIISMLRGVYKLRTCTRSLPKDTGKERPCLNYYIGKCCGPCTGNISEEEYAGKIKMVRKFLEGSVTELADQIREQMNEAAENLEFEKAAEYRDMLKLADAASQNQKMESNPGESRDVLGLAVEGFEAIMQVFFIRNGKLIDREHFYLTLAPEESREEIVTSFLKQYYSGTPFLPAEILLPVEIEDAGTISGWLSGKAGRTVRILVPQKGKKEKMVELAEQNARMVINNDREKLKREEMRTKGAVSEISKMLGISYAKRIESYDISNTMGVDSVGSMVVFEDGKPKKNDYRKFKIKTVQGPDDYASMAEVLKRRFEHSQWQYPDMLLIDGGRGQVNAVKEILPADIDIPVCGMVKDDHHRTRGLVYNDKEYVMDRTGEPFRLLTRIQDETHRFAIEYHKLLRGKGQVRSVLDDIPGIGPKRRLALTRYFKSIDRIKEAGIEELSKPEGMNIRAAESVYEYFHSQKAAEETCQENM